MRLFITGSEGFIGRELVFQCKNKGIEVFTADLLNGHGLAHSRLDIGSKEIMSALPDNVDAVVHLAGLTRNADCKDKAYDCFQANVMATLNLIEAAQKRNVKQFIFASSEWIYGEDQKKILKNEDSFIDIMSLNSEYALSKIVSEINLKQKFQRGFCPVAILRFGIVYGSRAHNWSAVEYIFNQVRAGREVRIGSLKTGRCFIHVSDIASGIIKSIGLVGFNILNLAGNRFVMLKDVIETSARMLDRNPAIIETEPRNVSIRLVSNEKAKKVLGWEPCIDLEAGLGKLGQFLCAQQTV